MEYGFFLAEVVDIAHIKDSRLGVRVLPYMKGISKTECPVWPSFFKDSLYTGKIGDLVWVICDKEWSMGYVFGLANYNTYSESTDAERNAYEKSKDNISLSIPTALTDAISQASAEVDGLYLNLDNVKVTYWDDNCIHYIERSTGGKVIAFKSGSLYIMRQNEFLMKIGSNVIKVGPESMSISGGKVKIQSDYIGLGNGQCNGNVLVTNGVSGLGAYASKAVHA